MLEELFGNKSIQKILLFLLVNEKCYATQIHRLLQTPLTPIQKALERLEKGKILHSFFEGKTRYFAFDPTCPLRNEIEILLKKIYTLLPPYEKKNYYYIKPTTAIKNKHPKELLLELFGLLKKMTQVDLKVKGGEDRGFKEAKGEVAVADDLKATLIFYEEGYWIGPHSQIRFSNVFRWHLNLLEGLLSLEHLRFGVENPVFLFHLVPKGLSTFESIHPHLCGEDTYFGHLYMGKKSIHLNWRILGPKKNEEIEYTYY